MRMHFAREMLRIRWDVDCVLGVSSQHHFFVNNLTPRFEELDTTYHNIVVYFNEICLGGIDKQMVK